MTVARDSSAKFNFQNLNFQNYILQLRIVQRIVDQGGSKVGCFFRTE